MFSNSMSSINGRGATAMSANNLAVYTLYLLHCSVVSSTYTLNYNYVGTLHKKTVRV